MSSSVMSAPKDWLLTPEQLSDSPSRRDDVSAETEERYRWEGSQFIRDIGIALDLQPRTYCAGISLYHRFYSLYSFRKFHRFDMAAACLFVGGKVEEQPKKLFMLLPVVHQLKRKRAGKSIEPGFKPDSRGFRELKERVLASERALLQAMRFDLVVDQPYGPLIEFAKAVTVASESKCPNDIVQKAWNYVSDSFMTPLCVQYRPEVIAAALLNLAGSMSEKALVLRDEAARRDLGPDRQWWLAFLPDTKVTEIEDICHQLLNLYEWLKSHNTGKAATPAVGTPS